MFDENPKSFDVTALVGSAKVEGLNVRQQPSLLLRRASGVEIVSLEGRTTGRLPVAVSPSGKFGAVTTPAGDVLEIGGIPSRDFVSGPMPLPAPPIAAAISSKGRVWVTLADGRLLYRTTSGKVSTLPSAARYEVLKGGAEDVFAASDGRSVSVLDARGTVLHTLAVPSRHFGFPSATECVVLEESAGPLVIHRRQFKGTTHGKFAPARSTRVLCIDAPATRALTTNAQQEVLLVDLETGTEKVCPLPTGSTPVAAAFCTTFGTPWLLSSLGAQLRVDVIPA